MRGKEETKKKERKEEREKDPILPSIANLQQWMWQDGWLGTPIKASSGQCRQTPLALPTRLGVGAMEAAKSSSSGTVGQPWVVLVVGVGQGWG